MLLRVSKTASLHRDFFGKSNQWMQFRSCYFLRFLRHLNATLNLCLMKPRQGVIEIESEPQLLLSHTLVASLYGVLDCFCTARDMLVTGPSVMVMLLTNCSVVTFIVSIRLIMSFRSILWRSLKNNEFSRSCWFWMKAFLKNSHPWSVNYVFGGEAWWMTAWWLFRLFLRWSGGGLGVLLLRNIFCQCLECTLSTSDPQEDHHHHRKQ